MVSILTLQQETALKLIARTQLANAFYFSGGTALAYFYLQHRKSEDLDFFCAEEFDPQQVIVALKSLKPQLKYLEFDYQSSFNRNLYFLLFDSEYILKLEFTYYPFVQVKPPTKKNGLLVDSVLDIAVNKLFTIVQKPRGRDYYDLYFIIQKYKYTFEQLRMLAKQKFDWHVDPLQLASRLHEVDQHLDDPVLTQDVNNKQLVKFFQKQAIEFNNQILI